MEHLPTIIVGGIVAIIFVSIIVKSIKNIKSGKGGCSCGCSGCGKVCDCKSQHDGVSDK